MFAKKIKYEDYEGNAIEETFYFNISRAEMLRMQMGTAGGYDEYLKRIIAAKDESALYKEFENLVKLSYGVKSDDKKHFIKSESNTELFMQSEAYSELIMEFLSNTQSVIEFVNGIMPKEVVESMKKEQMTNVN